MRMTSFVVGMLMASVFQASNSPPKNLGEITVERINVVEPDGTLRLVISNRQRMHPGVIDGVTIDRTRQEAGLIFFNDAGDEMGGLTYAGRSKNAPTAAEGGIMFDQLHQDQTIGFEYSENEGRRSAGFSVWDRSDRQLGDIIRKLNEAKRLPDAAARSAAEAQARADMPPGPRRVYVGKNRQRAATVSLADGNGKPRLTLTVDADGNPRIELLDENGKVTNRWPAQR